MADNDVRNYNSTVMKTSTLRFWIYGTAAFGVSMASITSLGISTVSDAESKMLAQPVVKLLETPSLESQLKALEAHGLELAREDEVLASDSIASLFERLGVEDSEALIYLAANKTNASVLKANVGKTALVHTDINGSLLRLQLVNGQDTWVVERTGEGQFATRIGQVGVETVTEHRSVMVGKSFLTPWTRPAFQVPSQKTLSTFLNRTLTFVARCSLVTRFE